MDLVAEKGINERALFYNAVVSFVGGTVPDGMTLFAISRTSQIRCPM